MSACVFVGPTLPAKKVAAVGGFVRLPPVAQGDVYRAVRAGAQAIGIIDGYFSGVPAVWHKEILWAIAQGIPVFGSASMGALRAAELHAFGMRGVGRIFEDYRNGSLEDDDEVAVLHGPAETGYVVLSEPMVNLRATLDRAGEEKVIPMAAARTLTTLAKELFYQERTWDAVFSAAASSGLPEAEMAALRDWLPAGKVDRKGEDALAMLAAMADWLSGERQPPEADFEFEWTDMWDTAIAGAPTVGLDAATATEAVPPARLLDELRIDGDAYRSAKAAALARLLALREADRRRLSAGREAVSDAIDRLRGALGLYNRAELEKWLAANDLATADLERLMEEEALLETLIALVEPSLDQPLIDGLRLTGEYRRFADRAMRKHAVLSRLGLPDPEPGDIDMAPPQLVHWYFRECLDQPVPDDIDGYIWRLGIADRQEFYRLLTRERLFSGIGGASDENF